MHLCELSVYQHLTISDTKQTSGCMYLIETYAALTAASAIAANGLLRYILGGTFPLFTVQSKPAPRMQNDN